MVAKTSTNVPAGTLNALTFQNTIAVYISGDQIGYLIGRGAVHQDRLLKTNAEELAQSHDEEDRDRGTNGGERDIPHTAESACAVQTGRFIKAGIDACHGGKIDDGAPAKALPDTGTDIQGAEPALLREEVNGVNAEHAQKAVHNAAVGGEHGLHQTDHNDHRDEVGKIADGLYRFLVTLAAHFVEQQRKDDGNREIEDEVVKTQQQGVPDQTPAERTVEKLFEVFQSCPRAFQNAYSGLKSLNAMIAPYMGVYLNTMK